MKSASYSGICGGRSFSRSLNAQRAEAAGREPATRAAKTWGFKSAKALREWVSTREWHHVGKFANAVEYYDVEEWINEFDGELADLTGLSRALTSRGRELVLAPLVKNIVATNNKPSKISKDWLSRSRLVRHLQALCGIETGTYSDAVEEICAGNFTPVEIAGYMLTIAEDQRDRVRAARREEYHRRVLSQMAPRPIQKKSRYQKMNRYDRIKASFQKKGLRHFTNQATKRVIAGEKFHVVLRELKDLVP